MVYNSNEKRYRFYGSASAGVNNKITLDLSGIASKIVVNDYNVFIDVKRYFVDDSILNFSLLTSDLVQDSASRALNNVNNNVVAIYDLSFHGDDDEIQVELPRSMLVNFYSKTDDGVTNTNKKFNIWVEFIFRPKIL